MHPENGIEKVRCALVTGASSGIGEAIAQRLASDGLLVFGASRHPPGEASGGVRPVALDVTDDDSARSAIDFILRTAGRLDVVVNNAGATLVGALEETSTEEARWLVETNLLGVHRVTRAALPLLRDARGHVVIIGSIAGFLAKPAEGFYSATKHALEGYFDVLKFELEPFGVRASLVEPGFVRTNLAAKATTVRAPLAIYDSMRTQLAAGLANDVRTGINPEDVANCVSRIIASETPRSRYLVGDEASKLRRLKNLLPTRLFEWGLRRRFSGGNARK